MSCIQGRLSYFSKERKVLSFLSLDAGRKKLNEQRNGGCCYFCMGGWRKVEYWVDRPWAVFLILFLILLHASIFHQRILFWLNEMIYHNSTRYRFDFRPSFIGSDVSWKRKSLWREIESRKESKQASRGRVSQGHSPKVMVTWLLVKTFEYLPTKQGSFLGVQKTRLFHLVWLFERDIREY